MLLEMQKENLQEHHHSRNDTWGKKAYTKKIWFWKPEIYFLEKNCSWDYVCRHIFFHFHMFLLVAGLLQCTLHSQGYSLLQATINSLFKWKYGTSKIHRQWTQSSKKDGSLQNGQMQIYESEIYLTINWMFQWQMARPWPLDGNSYVEWVLHSRTSVVTGNSGNPVLAFSS